MDRSSVRGRQELTQVVDYGAVLARNVVVVLVQPQHSGNVGAVARAMRNMGLFRLVLVDPPAFDPERARWMAPGCHDVIAQARIVATLDEALEGVHRAWATTARHRRWGQPVLAPDALATQVLDTPELTHAVLFGREDFGLPRDAVARCGAVVRIPTPAHASLNLAQAALVVARDLFEEARRRGLVATGRIIESTHGTSSTLDLGRGDRRDRAAELNHIEPAIDELLTVLERVGYTRGTSPDKVRTTTRQVFQQTTPSVRQVEALRGMIAKLAWALDHPTRDD